MLSTTTQAVQQDRLQAAQTLSDQLRCTVVLKGSGSVIAAPDGALGLNPSGNHRLAIASTALLFVLGLWLLRPVDVARGMAAALKATRQ